ncbi:MAG: NADH-quinone oxidoreductase subunit C [Dermatophilaceae bacterium]
MTLPGPQTTRALATTDSLRAQVSALLGQGWRLALVCAADDPPTVDAESFRVVHVFLRPIGQRHELLLRVPRNNPTVPTLADLSFPAGRFEREVRDLFGITPVGHPLPRRLVRHGHWPPGWYPMRRDAGAPPAFDSDLGSYPFVEVTGTGVYDIPVGPIHAGLIEPGHFRFSVVGETILRMKARLWFLHRGMEELFEGKTPQQAIALAERVSGDTAVGHSLALLTAVEDATGITPGAAVQARRALLLELERLHNHVADLGALANDVGFGLANAHAQRIRETLLRHNEAVTGHRLLRGALTIGDARLRTPDLTLLTRVGQQVAQLADLTLGHFVVADRFTGTAALPPERAAELGTLGYVARASGLPIDARCDHPSSGLPHPHELVLETSGDVRARYLVRVREIEQSLRLIIELAAIAERADQAPQPGPLRGSGLGVVEAWRGTLVHRVELGRDGRLTRVKIVDPSWFNWPALSVALADTIVPDFPLANKSFNQSYAGNDL